MRLESWNLMLNIIPQWFSTHIPRWSIDAKRIRSIYKTRSTSSVFFSGNEEKEIYMVVQKRKRKSIIENLSEHYMEAISCVLIVCNSWNYFTIYVECKYLYLNSFFGILQTWLCFVPSEFNAKKKPPFYSNNFLVILKYRTA